MRSAETNSKTWREKVTANRLYLLIYLLIGAAFLAAFKVGELVELETLLDARAKSSYQHSTQNVHLVVHQGTRGRIRAIERLRSGSYGIEVETPSGGTVWVLRRNAFSPVRLFKLDGHGSIVKVSNPMQAQMVEFERDMPGITQLVNPMSGSVAEPKSRGVAGQD